MLLFFLADMPRPVDSDLSEVLLGEGLNWSQLEKMLNLARETKPDLSVGALQSFLFVVHRLSQNGLNEVTVKDVAEGVKAPYATVARHCDVLCDGPKGSGGLRWLMKVPGTKRKTKSLRLTSFGHLFLSTALLSSP